MQTTALNNSSLTCLVDRDVSDVNDDPSLFKLAFHGADTDTDTDSDTDTDILARIVARMSARRSACHRPV